MHTFTPQVKQYTYPRSFPCWCFPAHLTTVHIVGSHKSVRVKVAGARTITSLGRSTLLSCCYLVDSVCVRESSLDSREQRSVRWMLKLCVCFRCKASQPMSPAAFVFTICKSNNFNKYYCCLTHFIITVYENSTLFVSERCIYFNYYLYILIDT